jgi:hypothetical protein
VKRALIALLVVLFVIGVELGGTLLVLQQAPNILRAFFQ